MGCLKRFPCSGHFTLAARSSSDGKQKNGGSFSGGKDPNYGFALKPYDVPESGKTSSGSGSDMPVPQ
jgi:hypothetical protein